MGMAMLQTERRYGASGFAHVAEADMKLIMMNMIIARIVGKELIGRR